MLFLVGIFTESARLMLDPGTGWKMSVRETYFNGETRRVLSHYGGAGPG